METFLSIIAGLSLLAFVVGMFKPASVFCKSRGRVALIYLGLFLVSVFIGASLLDDDSALDVKKDEKDEKVEAKDEIHNSSDSSVEEKSPEIPVLTKGTVYTMEYGNSDVKITFDNIQVKRIPNNGLNLILSLIIKNNSNETFFISNCDWKLLDSDKVEVDEAGIYEPMLDDFMPGSFFFTTVSPNVGKKEKVGYSVKKETYYLSIDGKIIAQIPLNKKE